MTGPDHFIASELLLGQAGEIGPGAMADQLLAAAQVHATLAQTAAIRDAAYGEMSIAASDAWDAVLGEVSSQ